MTDCSQLQALLDEAKQERQAMDQPNYCFDQCDPGDVTCIKQCRMSLPQWKRQKDQEIADIEFSMGLCGTWSIAAHVIVEVGKDFEGSFTITGGSEELTGTMSSSDNEPTSTITGSYDSGQSTIRFSRNINSNGLLSEDFGGKVDLSTNPPSMSGQMTLVYQPGSLGFDPVYVWSAQKQS